MRALYSFVIDEDSRFVLESRIFLRTILGAGVKPRDVVAQVTARSGDVGKSLAARFGVRALDLPLGPDGAYCNKINQLFTLADDDFDVLVACDTDLAITRPLDEVAKPDCVQAKRVDQENPPLAVLEQIREFLRFPQQPPLAAPGCSPAATTYAMNCNGGVLLIPRQFMQPLGEAWLGYAKSLTEHRHLLRQWVNHIDQVSWTFAMLKLALPFRELPVEYNFPTNLAKRIPRGTYAQPVVLHYHRALDRKGRLRLSGVRLVDKSIREANSHLGNIAGHSSNRSAGTMTSFYGRWVLPAAGVLLALATIAGALGAHAFAARWSPGRLDVYETAVRYQFYQSLGLLGMGVVLRGLHPDNLTSARRMVVQRFARAPHTLLVGIVAFCGSLYALSLGAPPSWVGWLTPAGGVLLIFAWLQFAHDVWRL
ncbi:MAG TPA: DUF423 domain-containing protein [Steroidobacteraceae bacterium]|nr:DUF423 domain-containing protein [Steroidobacteraceae bacterium]